MRATVEMTSCPHAASFVDIATNRSIKQTFGKVISHQQSSWSHGQTTGPWWRMKCRVLVPSSLFKVSIKWEFIVTTEIYLHMNLFCT